MSSINNKLQQPEEAFGVLEYARKHHRADLVSQRCLSFHISLILLSIALYRLTLTCCTGKLRWVSRVIVNCYVIRSFLKSIY